LFGLFFFLASLPFKHRLAPVDPKGDALAFKQLYLTLLQKLTSDYKNSKKNFLSQFLIFCS